MQSGPIPPGAVPAGDARAGPVSARIRRPRRTHAVRSAAERTWCRSARRDTAGPVHARPGRALRRTDRRPGNSPRRARSLRPARSSRPADSLRRDSSPSPGSSVPAPCLVSRCRAGSSARPPVRTARSVRCPSVRTARRLRAGGQASVTGRNRGRSARRVPARPPGLDRSLRVPRWPGRRSSVRPRARPARTRVRCASWRLRPGWRGWAESHVDADGERVLTPTTIYAPGSLIVTPGRREQSAGRTCHRRPSARPALVVPVVPAVRRSQRPWRTGVPGGPGYGAPGYAAPYGPRPRPGARPLRRPRAGSRAQGSSARRRFPRSRGAQAGGSFPGAGPLAGQGGFPGPGGPGPGRIRAGSSRVRAGAGGPVPGNGPVHGNGHVPGYATAPGYGPPPGFGQAAGSRRAPVRHPTAAASAATPGAAARPASPATPPAQARRTRQARVRRPQGQSDPYGHARAAGSVRPARAARPVRRAGPAGSL